MRDQPNNAPSQTAVSVEAEQRVFRVLRGSARAHGSDEPGAEAGTSHAESRMTLGARQRRSAARSTRPLRREGRQTGRGRTVQGFGVPPWPNQWWRTTGLGSVRPGQFARLSRTPQRPASPQAWRQAARGPFASCRHCLERARQPGALGRRRAGHHLDVSAARGLGPPGKRGNAQTLSATSTHAEASARPQWPRLSGDSRRALCRAQKRCDAPPRPASGAPPARLSPEPRRPERKSGVALELLPRPAPPPYRARLLRQAAGALFQRPAGPRRPAGAPKRERECGLRRKGLPERAGRGAGLAGAGLPVGMLAPGPKAAESKRGSELAWLDFDS